MREHAEGPTATSPRRIDGLSDGSDGALAVDACADVQATLGDRALDRWVVETTLPDCGGDGRDRSGGIAVRRWFEFDHSVCRGPGSDHPFRRHTRPAEEAVDQLV